MDRNSKWNSTAEKLPADKQKVIVNINGARFSARYQSKDSTFFIFAEKMLILSADHQRIEWMEDQKKVQRSGSF